jgi:mannose-6-phosphate isomerase-like protein (cupin superfamily)
MDCLRHIRAVTLLCVVSLATIGCKAYMERGAKGIGLLPKPADADQHLSTYRPRDPYSQLAPGLLARTVYQTAGPAGTRVAVTDYLIGPKQHTSSIMLPGAAICEVRSGDGVVRLAGTEQKVTSGTTFSIQQGTAVVFENTGDLPLAIQLHLIQTE